MIVFCNLVINFCTYNLIIVYLCFTDGHFYLVNPSTKPEIIGIKPNYGIGELVNVTCKSAPSRPQTSLKWFINGQEVRSLLNGL